MFCAVGGVCGPRRLRRSRAELPRPRTHRCDRVLRWTGELHCLALPTPKTASTQLSAFSFYLAFQRKLTKGIALAVARGESRQLEWVSRWGREHRHSPTICWGLLASAQARSAEQGFRQPDLRVSPSTTEVLCATAHLGARAHTIHLVMF